MPSLNITDEQIRAKAVELGLISADVSAGAVPARARMLVRPLVAQEQIKAQRKDPKPVQVDGRHLAANARAMYTALVGEGFTEAQALAVCGHALSRHVN